MSIVKFKKRVLGLHLAEKVLERRKEQIGKPRYNKIKRNIEKAWMDVWDEYPDKNNLSREFLDGTF